MLLVAGAAATADMVVRVDHIPASHEVGSIDRVSPGTNGWLPGGSAAAVALAASPFGPVRLFQPLPLTSSRNSLEGDLAATLSRHGVDTDWCPRAGDYATRCLTIITSDGERLCWSEPAPQPELTDATILEQIEHVVFTPRWGSWASTLADFASDLSVPVSLVGGIPSGVKDIEFQFIVADYKQVETALAKHEMPAACTVISTAGSDGATVTQGESTFRIDARAVEPVDSTGAGDVFSGTFIAAALAGHSMAEAGRLASLEAAEQCRRWGALPTTPVTT